MADRSDTEIDEKSGAGQPDDVHEGVIRLDEDTKSYRHRERLNEDSDSVSNDSNDGATLAQNQRAGNREHDRRPRDCDDDHCERNEREDVLDWYHTSSLGRARH